MRRRSSLRSLSGLGIAFGVSALCWGGCTINKPTELVAGVITQIQVPRDLKSVRVTAQISSGVVTYAHFFPVTDGTVRLPGTLGFVPDGNPNLAVTFSIVGTMGDAATLNVEAYDGDTVKPSAEGDGLTRVLRRAVSHYIDGRVLFLPMPLSYACYDHAPCKPLPDGTEQTCRAGVCKPAVVAPESLRNFTPELIEGDAQSCFNQTQCLSGALPVQAVFDQPPTTGAVFPDIPSDPSCRFRLPAKLPDGTPTPPGDPQTYNVRVIYGGDWIADPAADPKAPVHLRPRAEILNYDAEEGFYIPDPNQPDILALGSIVCEAQKEAVETARSNAELLAKDKNAKVFPAHPITAVMASRGALAPGCLSKTAYQPVCEDDSTLPGGIALPAQLPIQKDDVCVDTQSLTPAPSALYILMDRSYGMHHFFGPKKVKTVLELTLKDPAINKAWVGTKFLPASATDCNAAINPYSQLPIAASSADPFTLPFQYAPDAQAQLANVLTRDGVYIAPGETTAAPANFLADNPPLALDVALAEGGAYKALRALPESKNFNKLGVVLIGNRDFVASACASGTDVNATLARNAAYPKADSGLPPVTTYVVLLPHDPFTDPGDPKVNPAGNAALIDAASAIANDPSVADPTDANAKENRYFFDATTNPDIGADALNTIVAEMGSCLYDPPAGSAVLDYVSQSGILSYFNPLIYQRADIAFNAACTPTSSANGWNYDGNRVRICGSSCDTLRTVLKITAALAEQEQQEPPNLPISVQQPCQ